MDIKKLPKKIRDELDGYEEVDDLMKIRKYDRVKYIKRDTNELKRGGLVVTGDKDKRYLVIQSVAPDKGTGRKVRFSVQFDKVWLFRKMD